MGKILLLLLAFFFCQPDIQEPTADFIYKAQLYMLAQEDPFLLLVNKNHALPENYHIDLIAAGYGSKQVSVDIYDALQAMLSAGSQEGLSFVVCSGYRDYEYQKGLLDADIAAEMAKGRSYEEAYAIATQETMPPGYSEHSTGLAVDIAASYHQALDAGLASTPEIQWLQAHCAEYGFILRYPEDKEEITQISYESWHFRYVGVEAATDIMSRRITLEEYLDERIFSGAEWIDRAVGALRVIAQDQ